MLQYKYLFIEMGLLRNVYGIVFVHILKGDLKHSDSNPNRIEKALYRHTTYDRSGLTFVCSNDQIAKNDQTDRIGKVDWVSLFPPLFEEPIGKVMPLKKPCAHHGT